MLGRYHSKCNSFSIVSYGSILSGTGNVPCSRMGHAVCLVASILYVHGGFSDYHQVHRDLYSVDLNTLIWMKIDTQMPLPACFSHSMTPIGNCLMLIGGCPRQPATAISFIELPSGLLCHQILPLFFWNTS